MNRKANLTKRQPQGRKTGNRRRPGGKKNGIGSSGNPMPAEPRRNNTDVLARWMPLFPARTIKKLRYSSGAYIVGTSGIVASHVLSANGMYDPDITGTGHQPMGFDQLMLSYNHYVVTEARLIATFHNQVTSSTPNISVKIDGSATPVTVIDTINEFGYNVHSVLEAKGSSGSVKVLETKVKIGRFEGVDDVTDVIDLRGSNAANPAEQTYFHIQSWDNTASSTNILVEYVIEYTAMFLEPRVLSPSLRAELSRLVVNEEKRQSTVVHCARLDPRR